VSWDAARAAGEAVTWSLWVILSCDIGIEDGTNDEYFF